MRYLLLLTVLFSLPLFAQEEKCASKKSTPSQKRLKNYPFNQTAKVLAVSYIADSNSYGQIHRKVDYSLPVKNDTICYSKLHETVTLSARQVDTLTSILFNYTLSNKVHIQPMCYRPRNALIFLNAKGESFAYMEICFECEGMRSSNKKIPVHLLCSTQYALLKQLFIHSGIRYGPETTIFNGI